jgi:hypothetical protein
MLPSIFSENAKDFIQDEFDPLNKTCKTKDLSGLLQ